MTAHFDTPDPLAPAAERLKQLFNADAVARDKAGGRPVAQIKALKQSGLVSAQIPLEYGGKGAHWADVLRVVRRFATTDGSLAHLFGYHHLPIHAVNAYGTEEQKHRWLSGSARENWLWGNSGNAMSPTSHGVFDSGRWVVNGERPFSSGSHVADVLQVSFNDGNRRISAVIPASRAGIEIVDDWDGIGQRQTGSGTVRFRDVVIAPDEVFLTPDTPQTPFGSLVSLLQQAVLANVFIGSAEGALAEGRTYTETKSRPWVYSGYEKHTDDPFVVRKYGELHIRILAAIELAEDAAAELDRAFAQGPDLTEAGRGAAAVALAAANVYAGDVALQAGSGIFQVMGARSATKANGFDRFWRNARTHTLHNPAEYKKRTLGTYVLEGLFPEGGLYR